MNGFGSTMVTLRNTHVRLLVGAGVAFLLSACGGNSPPELLAASSDIAVGAPVPGPTPFISVVPLTGQSLKQVSIYRFQIAPKAGAVSRPVDVRYTAAAMARRGFHADGSSTASLPVFGLYGGYTNPVKLEMIFTDGSRQENVVNIVTPAYVDPNAKLDRPALLQRRTSAGPTLNYLLLKSALAGPLVMDSDAEVRWIAPGNVNAYTATFHDNAFYIGAQNALGLSRIELDGATSASTVPAQMPSYPLSSFTNFHHNLDHAKGGFLAEFDGTSNGVRNAGSMLANIDSKGAILKDWDFATIIRQYMLDNGDDPSKFVRAGADWFHMNASTYDARDNSVIASSRENFLVKIDYNSGAIKWIFGDPTKYWYTFPSLRAKSLTLAPGGLYPIGQHAISINSSGQLMLFNNGGPSFNQPIGAPVGEARAYSAVSAYDIDPVAMTAREVMNFDYGKTILSDICSSAYEAPGGGFLVNYAVASGRTRTRVVGVDAAKTVMFDFEFLANGCTTSWNAEPIAFDGLTIQ